MDASTCLIMKYFEQNLHILGLKNENEVRD